MRYCPDCGGGIGRTVPAGDNRRRYVCDDCGTVHYQNPRMVVGAVCVWDGKLLMCRRAIAPRIGFWTIPAGFLELDETTAEGAAREVHEEAGARIAIERLLAVYDLPHIGQVQIFYAADMLSPAISAGIESQEVALFDWADIPWDELAFPTVKWALNDFRANPADTATRTPAATGTRRPRADQRF